MALTWDASFTPDSALPGQAAFRFYVKKTTGIDLTVGVNYKQA